MYIPKHFEIVDEEEILSFIDQYSFATLFSTHAGIQQASHLPLLLDRQNNMLLGHFARANNHWEQLDSREVLVVFHGPHAYISPSWYETSKAVPTWNYVSVHVYGSVELIHNPKEEWEILNKLVNKYEKPDSSYKFTDVDPIYVENLSKAIVSFKINITKIEGKAKLSQNHPENRQNLIIEQLKKLSDENSLKIAALMKEKRIERG